MAFTSITKPAVGKPTRKTAHIDAIIDDLNYLNGELSTVKGNLVVINGGMELDTDADGSEPDGWTLALLNSGAAAISSADSYDGDYCWTATTLGGAGNGGATLTSTDLIQAVAGEYYWITFAHMCSAAGVSTKVEMIFYDEDENVHATRCVYKSVINPTSWVKYECVGLSPSGTKYMKIRLTGGVLDGATAGTAYFDAVRFGRKQCNMVATDHLPLGPIFATESNSAGISDGSDGVFERYTCTAAQPSSCGITTAYALEGRFDPHFYAKVRLGGTLTAAMIQIAGLIGSAANMSAYLQNKDGLSYYQLVTDNGSGVDNTVNTTIAPDAALAEHDIWLWYDNTGGKITLVIDNEDPIETGTKVPTNTTPLRFEVILLKTVGADVQSVDCAMFDLRQNI